MAMWCACTACGAARPRQSRQSRTAIRHLARDRPALEEIELPEGATIGAIVRGEKVIIAHHDTVIHADDHVILFLMDHKHTEAVERLFQGGTSFN